MELVIVQGSHDSLPADQIGTQFNHDSLAIRRARRLGIHETFVQIRECCMGSFIERFDQTQTYAALCVRPDSDSLVPHSGIPL